MCAVGACRPDQREMDTPLVARGRVFVDSREGALAEAGDVLIPIREGAFDGSHIVGELGELLSGVVPGRRAPTEITIFKSLGMAVEDVAAAHLAYEESRGAGTWPRVRACSPTFLFRRSAHRFFIISEMRFRASGRHLAAAALSARRICLDLCTAVFREDVQAAYLRALALFTRCRQRGKAILRLADFTFDVRPLPSRSPRQTSSARHPDSFSVVLGTLLLLLLTAPLRTMPRHSTGYHSHMNPGRPTSGLLLLVVALAVSPPDRSCCKCPEQPRGCGPVRRGARSRLQPRSRRGIGAAPPRRRPRAR